MMRSMNSRVIQVVELLLLSLCELETRSFPVIVVDIGAKRIKSVENKVLI